ncbi:hypothetical protein M0813_14538 [Anaeramoeba flamelloides]|uniref:Uncharacterized protein n=1 Tax=Anaeramoeba flamelloides TaxID=1746091 RepID=A0ABQ8Z5C6_9EUKA|nr:hypothetical protein M0813_14538 [Anaeramoeba flamelloides]
MKNLLILQVPRNLKEEEKKKDPKTRFKFWNKKREKKEDDMKRRNLMITMKGIITVVITMVITMTGEEVEEDIIMTDNKTMVITMTGE